MNSKRIFLVHFTAIVTVLHVGNVGGFVLIVVVRFRMACQISVNMGTKGALISLSGISRKVN